MGTLSAGSSENETDVAVTLTGAGFTASTAYVLSISRAGGSVSNVDVTTDGAGGFTYQYVPQSPGQVTVTAAPKVAPLEATLTLENVS